MQKLVPRKCRKKTIEDNANMQDVFWYFTHRSSQQTEGQFEEQIVQEAVGGHYPHSSW